MGTKLLHRGRRVLSYEPARKFVWHLCLRSEDDFRDWAVNSRRGAVFIPRDPEVAYADRGWVGWEVRSSGTVANANANANANASQFATIDDVARCRTLTSDWFVRLVVQDFLGAPVDFETCRAYARSLKLTSQHDWWELARRDGEAGGLPHRIPARPGQYYRDKGWQGYADFLGIPEREDTIDLGYR